MALNGVESDMPPKGDLSLKALLGNNLGLNLPAELDLPPTQRASLHGISMLDRRLSHVASGPDRRRMAPCRNQGRQAMAESTSKTPVMFDPEALLSVQRRTLRPSPRPAASWPTACGTAPRASSA
jgi:hypothetical protein